MCNIELVSKGKRNYALKKDYIYVSDITASDLENKFKITAYPLLTGTLWLMFEQGRVDKC